MSNLNSTQIHDMRADERAAVRAAAAGAPEPPRRGFFRKLLAMAVGGIVVAVPAAAGLAVFLDPVRKARKQGGSAADFIPVAPLNAVPADGRPAKFQVIADRSDAWNRYKNVPLGAVYVKRTAAGPGGDPAVRAWNVVCPHAGCFVDVAADGRSFRCPCHNSGFSETGAQLPGCVSPRPMDELPVDPDALKRGLVKVQFQNFVAGTGEKKAIT
jgi:menaquinol-cytochrome c reductase iron-sulfur subunit